MFAIAVAVVLKMWIKPPTLHVQVLPGVVVVHILGHVELHAFHQIHQLYEHLQLHLHIEVRLEADEQKEVEEPEEPEGPTDDELYPDDGYNGDMPTVSGNRKEGVYTFLLVGTDQDDGNTDTLMVDVGLDLAPVLDAQAFLDEGLDEVLLDLHTLGVASTGSLRDTQHNAIMAVRRGEAYYDGDGNLVYGQPPASGPDPWRPPR